jgi:hypothetical protein
MTVTSRFEKAETHPVLLFVGSGGLQALLVPEGSEGAITAGGGVHGTTMHDQVRRLAIYA